jgi:hypothetical protein
MEPLARHIIWLLVAALALFVIVLMAWTPTGTGDHPIKSTPVVVAS